MSIINDALHKASREKEGSPPQEPAPPQPSQDISAQRNALKSANTKAKPKHGIVTYIFSGIFMLGSMVFLFTTITGKSIIPAPQRPAPPAADLPTHPQQKVPVKPLPSKIETVTTAPAPSPAVGDQDSKTPSVSSNTISEGTTEPPSLQFQPDINKSEYAITGIVQGEGDPMAIINGSVYLVGDEIGEAKIVEISEQKVVLEYYGRKFDIRVR